MGRGRWPIKDVLLCQHPHGRQVKFNLAAKSRETEGGSLPPVAEGVGGK